MIVNCHKCGGRYIATQRQVKTFEERGEYEPTDFECTACMNKEDYAVEFAIEVQRLQQEKAEDAYLNEIDHFLKSL